MHQRDASARCISAMHQRDASAPTRTQSCEHALWFESGNFLALASDNKLL